MNDMLMPRLFIGTWKLPTCRETTQIVTEAINIGYRGIDCAYSYENDFFVGKAIKNSSVKRKDLFITNKLWNTFRDNEESITEACKKSLKLMKLDYFDLYLVHWPVPITESNWQEKNCIVWNGMEQLYKNGLVRSIGVSNYLSHHLDAIVSSSSIVPTVNQIEYHPGCNQIETLDYCKTHNITIQGWSPLGSGKLLGEKVIVEIAKRHKKSPAQICLRWALQNNVIPICRSANLVRLKENFNVFDFSINDYEMKLINNRVINNSSGFHPDDNQPSAL